MMESKPKPKLGKRSVKPTDDVLKGLSDVYQDAAPQAVVDQDQMTTVSGNYDTVVPQSYNGMRAQSNSPTIPEDTNTTVLQPQATEQPHNPDITPSEDYDSTILQAHTTVVPQSQNGMRAQSNSPIPPEEPSTVILQSQNTEQPHDPDIVQPNDHATVVPQSYNPLVDDDLDDELPEYQWDSSGQSGDGSIKKAKSAKKDPNKRPGSVQMTIWVPEGMEPQLKLLSFYRNESISKMARDHFASLIEKSPHKDTIKAVAIQRKRKK